MRDIVLVTLIFGSIPFILRRPHIGVLVYVWLSVMNPHRLTWGFAYDFNFVAIIAVVTLVSMAFSRERTLPPFNALMVAMFLFAAWTCVTTVFAIMPDRSYPRWESFMKTQLMVFLIPMLFHTKERVRVLIWTIVLSVGYYGTKGGLWILWTGGSERVFGPPGSYIEDNNSLATAIVMTIPLMRYLQLSSPRRYVRWGLTAMMLLCGVAVLGSYSRGAFLAVIAMVAFLWIKSRRRLPLLVVTLAAIFGALSFMPQRWSGRMETITTYQADSSAMMRFNSWGTMFNIAKDRPIVGGGFELAAKEVYDRYSPDPSFPPQVAHSIYFQALGEHGFVGLALFLGLYLVFWRHAGAIIRLARKHRDLAWARDFGSMMQATLIGFAVGGAFLSLVNFDVPYYLVGVTVAIKSIVDLQLRRAPAVPENVRFDERSKPLPTEKRPELNRG